MDVIRHKMRDWEIKYGQIAISVKDYDRAIELFGRYLDRNFDIETSDGLFKNKHFLHYKDRKSLRLSCKPFFQKLQKGEVIYIQPAGEDRIKIFKEREIKDAQESIASTEAASKAEESASPIEIKTIIERLRTSQFKSESHTEFEEALKDSFNFLGFEAELIGGSGDTDVLLVANIGRESFKVNVDGKTSKSGKITDKQIDWISLRDHRNRRKADFVVVVGPDFSGGKLKERADEYNVSLLKTEDLIKLLEAHSKFPFTLTELRDLFTESGDISSQIEDLLAQNSSRRNLLEQFRVIIEEMQSLQDRLGYFTYESLAGRERIEELDINLDDIDYIIKLLKLPFINGVKEIEKDKYILTMRIKDIANIFYQISNLLVGSRGKEETSVPHSPKSEEPTLPEKELGSKYFKWEKRGNSIVAIARMEKPYEHYCPIGHFHTILQVIIDAFETHDVINTDLIFSMLKGKNLAPNRPFKGKPEEYKIRMALGILELEGLIKWTGSKRPIEYTLNCTVEDLRKWVNKNMRGRLWS